ncbi:hypothetical protein DPMN_178330 [Dreissena polymorpha]|uniref:Uncharacterized protein n=1 Tax=Dreissena polymorpha TaxID=45954 RepID=A0A9D4EBV9_DREPO|nr:hypothetical protein DPMN_178330 [Dreissena polymorpha]
MNRESLGRTSNDRRSTGNNRMAPGWHRSSTGAHTDAGKATAMPLLSPVVPR